MFGFAFSYAGTGFVQNRVLEEAWWAARDSNPGPPDKKSHWRPIGNNQRQVSTADTNK
jgi:hypothetical protein